MDEDAIRGQVDQVGKGPHAVNDPRHRKDLKAWRHFSPALRRTLPTGAAKPVAVDARRWPGLDFQRGRFARHRIEPPIPTPSKRSKAGKGMRRAVAERRAGQAGVSRVRWPVHPDYRQSRA
jgi:hypothetical protein